MSELGRPGVFRLSVGVGRERFEDLVGFAPAAYAAHRGAFDHTASDVLTPHPVYAAQGWVAILDPGDRTLAADRRHAARWATGMPDPHGSTRPN